jgi:hypothetical protein
MTNLVSSIIFIILDIQIKCSSKFRYDTKILTRCCRCRCRCRCSAGLSEEEKKRALAKRRKQERKQQRELELKAQQEKCILLLSFCDDNH